MKEKWVDCKIVINQFIDCHVLLNIASTLWLKLSANGNVFSMKIENKSVGEGAITISMLLNSIKKLKLITHFWQFQSSI